MNIVKLSKKESHWSPDLASFDVIFVTCDHALFWAFFFFFFTHTYILTMNPFMYIFVCTV